MIDWKRFSTIPTENNLRDYPTALDILKDIVSGEEHSLMYDMPLDKVHTCIPDLIGAGRYIMISAYQMDFPVLHPVSHSPFIYYRGQSEYHSCCLPSLYRYKGAKLEEEMIRSYFQTAEMILVMKTHPVIRYLETKGIWNDRLGWIPLVVMYDGLAQHYGIKTCFLDLTNDIWVATFFATTIYDGKEYHPKYIKESDSLKERFGVMYRLSFFETEKLEDSSRKDIMPIGLQYFNRPGKQCGLVRNMTDVRDLHLVPGLEYIFFRHDNDVSRLIFTLSQFSKKYMPEDSLVGIVEAICADDVFCEQTVELVKKIYYPNLTVEEIKTKASAYGFRFTNHLKISFDKEVMEAEYFEWQNGGAQRYMDSIVVKPVLKMNL